MKCIITKGSLLLSCAAIFSFAFLLPAHSHAMDQSHAFNHPCSICQAFHYAGADVPKTRPEPRPLCQEDGLTHLFPEILTSISLVFLPFSRAPPTP